MKSFIIRITERALFALLLLTSLFLFVRGHDEPGGGFVGGLLAVAAYTLRAFAWGTRKVRQSTPFEPETIAFFGIALAAATGLIGAAAGRPYLTHFFSEVELPFAGTLAAGSALLFDLGVYLTVFGSGLCVMLRLGEATGRP